MAYFFFASCFVCHLHHSAFPLSALHAAADAQYVAAEADAARTRADVKVQYAFRDCQLFVGVLRYQFMSCY
jgi:hypothetical protein